MVDVDTDLPVLCVMVDDFCQLQDEVVPPHPGPQASLSCSEVVTLSLFGQWVHFPSERAFYRYAEEHLQAAFPGLPARSQFNRLQRMYTETITAFGLFLVESTVAQHCHYERIDSSGIATRDSKRRGEGWLAGQADIGKSSRLGWYEGFHLLVSIAASGMITGYGFGKASTHDQLLLEMLLAVRTQPIELLSSAAKPALGCYIADKGKAFEKPHQRWRECYGAEVITPPHQSSKKTWPKEWRRWLACVKALSQFLRNCLIPFAWQENVHTPSPDFRLVWLLKLACTLFASG